MMESTALANQAVALLLLYLAKAGRAVAQRVGEGLWDQFRDAAAKLYRRVKEKFTTNSQAAADLSKLEQDPNSRGRQAVVEELLSKFIDGDRQFAQELETLADAVRRAGGDTITQTVNISHGTVGNVTQIGKIENGN